MAKVSVYDMAGKQTGEEIELNDAVFGVEVNVAVMHQALVMQLANQRQGTHSTKTRAAVRGGGKKPWRQKGTGRARSGSIRSPLWVGGGVVFGPTPRSHALHMPRKARRLALKSALTDKLDSGELMVLDQLHFEKPRTKDVVKLLGDFQASNGKALFITEGDEVVEQSARNIPGVKAIASTGINLFDLLHHDKIFITKGAVAQIEEVLA